MNINPLKEIWDQNKVAIGTYLMYSCEVAAVEVAAAAGLDFVLFDLEHRPQGPETIHDLSQVARLTGMASVVGPPDISQHSISHALDVGASAVLVPHVETVEDVSLAIQAVRYPPVGKRGRCNRAGHNLYRSLPFLEELDHCNDNVALLLKLESEAALSRVEELIEPDGVDGVLIGPTDLSLDMRLPGQTGHPKLMELIERALRACLDRRLHWGTLVGSPEEIPSALEEGASWIVASSEMDVLAGFWGQVSDAVKGSA